MLNPKLITQGCRTVRRQRSALVTALFLLLAPAALFAQAQESPIKELASRMAKSIAASKQKSVVVFDFVGPDDKFTPLGRDLADEFSAALAQPETGLTVADRKEIYDAMQKKHYGLQDLLGTDLAVSLAHDLGVQAVVFGKITVDSSNLVISVEAYRINHNRRIKGFRVSVPFTDEMKKLSAEESKEQNPLADFPQAGKNGYSFAACLYCPNPHFTELAVSDHIQGTVELKTVISADGYVKEIVVMKRLPDGLTEVAISAVQSWRFKPATGPDGKAAAVVMTIEVTFRLYK
ncbi:MAG: TonB family protein [Candidatus Acidiferrales bacterium]